MQITAIPQVLQKLPLIASDNHGAIDVNVAAISNTRYVYVLTYIYAAKRLMTTINLKQRHAISEIRK